MVVPTRAYLVVSIKIILLELIATEASKISYTLAEKSPRVAVGIYEYINKDNCTDRVKREIIADTELDDDSLAFMAQYYFSDIDPKTIRLEIQDNFPALVKFSCKSLSDFESILEGQESKYLTSIFKKKIKTICANSEQLFSDVPSNFEGLNTEENREARLNEYIDIVLSNLDDSDGDSTFFENHKNIMNDYFNILLNESKTNLRIQKFACKWIKDLSFVLKTGSLRVKFRSLYQNEPTCRRLEEAEKEVEEKNVHKNNAMAAVVTVKFNLFIFVLRLFI